MPSGIICSIPLGRLNSAAMHDFHICTVDLCLARAAKAKHEGRANVLPSFHHARSLVDLL